MEDLTHFSKLADIEKEATLSACQTTGKIYDGLEVSREIRTVDAQRLGDTILLRDDSKVAAFAVYHVGAKTEGGSGACYVNSARFVRRLVLRVPSNSCSTLAKHWQHRKARG